MFTNRQAGNPIFYKIETYLDRFLVLEIYIIPNFVKIDSVVLEIYEIYVQGQNDRQSGNLIFCKVETYLNRFLVLEIHIMLNSVKIIRAVLEIVNLHIYIQGTK